MNFEEIIKEIKDEFEAIKNALEYTINDYRYLAKQVYFDFIKELKIWSGYLDDIEESKKSLAIELQKSLKWMSEMDINAFMKICDFMEFDD